MKKNLFLFLFTISFMVAGAQSVFINEIHYDNTGGDVGEAIEIAGPAGTSLLGWELWLYNGNGGGAYNVIHLVNVEGAAPPLFEIDDEGNGFGAVAYFVSGIQNGAPDGIALVDNGTVVQFLSYEGTFTATSEGPASGMTSTDIGNYESSGTPVGNSLQLTGTGTVYGDFSWGTPPPTEAPNFGLATQSFGSLNAGQVFVPLAPPGPSVSYTFCATNTPLALDPPNTISTLAAVSDTGSPADTGLIGTALGEYSIANVDLNIQSGWASDLTFTLQSPSGTTLLLSGGNGGSNGLSTAENLVFTDASANDVTTWTGGAPMADYAPQGGTFASTFAGESINGDWYVIINDGVNGDGGSLNSYCITFNRSVGTPPEIFCPADFTADNDAGVCGAVVNFAPPIAIDAEDGVLPAANVVQTGGIPTGGFFPVGDNVVTFTATDSHLNETSCSFTITVLDAEDPVAVCQDVTVVLDAMGNGAIVASDLDGGSTDNCAVDSMSASQTAFTCGDVGTLTVTLTVFDVAGNFSTCDATVTVIDDIAPVIACLGETTGSTVFINEIHYDNAGSDQDEAIEIAGPAGTDLSTWSIVLYNGSNGTEYNNIALSGVIDDEGNGYGAINVPISGLQNGSPDGIVLANNNNVVQFISYEGTLTAADGIAAGMVSTDIGVSETSGTPIGESLQLTGTGSTNGDFVWNSPAISSPGSINVGQTITDPTALPPLEVALDADGLASLPATDLILGVDEACGYTVTVGSGGGATPTTLSTPLIGGNGNFGNMFDITATNEVTISSFDVHGDVGITFDVNVWAKSGTHVGSEDNINDWTLLGTAVGVVSNGDGATTPLGLDLGYTIPAGETHAFFVSPIGGGFNYHNGTAVGTSLASDGNIEIFEGSAKADDFTGTTFAPRVFEGNIIYTVGGGGSTGATLDLDCSNLGENIVEVFVTDNSGNTSSCFSTINVIDNIAPVLVCQDTTIELGEDGTAIIDPMNLLLEGTDNCGIDVLIADITDVSCADIGAPIDVTVLATDASGNVSSCTLAVTVVDTMAPVISCPPNEDIELDANGTHTLGDYIASAAATVTDNCTNPVTIFTQDPVAGTVLGFGVHTITFTAEDEYGNVSTCSFELNLTPYLSNNDNELGAAVSMYPNPARNLVTITNSSNMLLDNAMIYDINGKLISQINLQDMQAEKVIDISEFATGIYMVQINGEQASVVKRLIKE